MSNVKINPKMLILAREARGLSQVELATKIKSSQVNITRWELGSVGINEEAFKKVQKVLQFPKNFFVQTTEIYPPMFYRKRDKVSAKQLNMIDAYCNIYRLNVNLLLKATGHETTNIPVLNMGKKIDPKDYAIELRKIWKVNKGPVDSMTELLERNRFLMGTFNFGTERVDGQTILLNNKHPLILTNKVSLGDRQRFTIAFELGHIIMQAHDKISFGTSAGHNANLFAAEFLMPEKDILQDFGGTITLELLAELKKKWKVSMQALLYRASDLTLLTDNQKRYILSQFNQLKIRRREPPELDVPREIPILLRDLITKYRTKQKMNTTQIAAFLNLTEKEFQEMYTE